MKLVVGSNGSLECTSAIANASDGSVSEIYLSVKDSKYSSGRPNVVDLDIDHLGEHVEVSRKNGINITVAFNAVCYSGRETLPSFEREYCGFLESISSQGVDRIILAHPVLIGLTKRLIPEMHVSVSSFNRVDNKIRVSYFGEMGADRIILAAELNRKTNELGRIVEDNPDLEFEVILNNGCNYYCPLEYFHDSSQSHMHEFQEERSEHYPAECTKQLLAEPWTILLSPFIRPEDVSKYEELGVDLFKIAGRNLHEDWIVNVVRAYQERNFEGDLMTLLNRSFRALQKAGSQVAIPNQELGGFLEQIDGYEDYDKACKQCEELYERIKNKEYTE